MKNVNALLDAIDEEFAEIEQMYNASLRAKEVPDRLQTRIKSLIEHGRSVLDYLANGITETYGTPSDRTYYPYPQTEAEFPKRIDRDMAGVRAARPDVADAIKKYQAYSTPWIKHLNYLARENKHRILSPQERRVNVRREVRGPGGSTVSWDPAYVTFGAGAWIMGQPVDVASQRTPATMEVTYVDWLFADLGLSALEVLREIKDQIRPMADDIRHVAGLL